MSTQRGQKLNALQRLLPEGLVASTQWLKDAGYSSALRSKYVSSGWLEQPARGIYKRPGAEPQWQHLVVSLQSIMRLPVSVGGLTALEMLGYGHYIPLGNRKRVALYAEARLPKWLDEVSPSIQFQTHNAHRLFKTDTVTRAIETLPKIPSEHDETQAKPLDGGLRLYVWGDRGWPMIVSTPERATLEFLDDVPIKHSFEHAADLFTGLANLSPRRVQKLLETCESVKVKRLFLWFAERDAHAWFGRLDLASIDTGRGKRVIAKNGRLDAKYQITVPEGMHGD
ncbi:type IV toxin-antitoxin system AbiEi family antitoxin domain-containing protein [Aquicoccus porphyridii]|uniref:type IV toxin-antitoxin system AbiEi family antitoxin domain-containing protein n=1 Tax=Aquicoccus porphyridii TaxID=1852029 RepID=UPI00273D9C1D|nr:type IV toxin-antitoxin system AbiEi family antitoxin domain-containing protein [Aquicoccus porphyridii]